MTQLLLRFDEKDAHTTAADGTTEAKSSFILSIARITETDETNTIR
jgi:hypothetical protein